ncbi:Phosphatidate cytidylyltransferase [hydrothermal vent metagenome]|uniref:Phosphatidate cytidylyltransferase n=1 Tax=hydrothermal vent metagenome TaxID=652676 RepID=A0A3B0TL91_9ZZZZ
MNKNSQGDEPAPKHNASRSWADMGPRLSSAFVLLAITIFMVWLGGIWFALLVAGVFAGIYREWEVMICASPMQPLGYVLAGLLALVAIGTSLGGVMVGGAVFGVAILVAATGKRTALAWRVFALAFISLVIMALIEIRGTQLVGFYASFFLGATVWMTDTGALFAGRHFGGAKLNPEISPAKTWSGALGGLAVGTLSGLLVWIVAVPMSSWWVGALLAATLSLTGQLGDLSESAMKRHFRIKDSSDLIPGHGGLMDRLDSLTFGALLVFGIGLWHQGLGQIAQGILLW